MFPDNSHQRSGFTTPRRHECSEQQQSCFRRQVCASYSKHRHSVALAKTLSRETRSQMPGLNGSWVGKSLHEANLAFTSGCPLLLGCASISQIFRLIDVRQKKIVEFTSVDLSTLEYAALSYVWGGPQRVTLLKQNLVHLQQDGALGELPRTLREVHSGHCYKSRNSLPNPPHFPSLHPMC